MFPSSDFALKPQKMSLLCHKFIQIVKSSSCSRGLQTERIKKLCAPRSVVLTKGRRIQTVNRENNKNARETSVTKCPPRPNVNERFLKSVKSSSRRSFGQSQIPQRAGPRNPDVNRWRANVNTHTHTHSVSLAIQMPDVDLCPSATTSTFKS